MHIIILLETQAGEARERPTARPPGRIMRRLRDPVSGCEWDSVQTFATIAPYTIEEAYEVADAIARNDMERSPTNSATFSSRSCSMRKWPRKPAISRSTT